MGKHLWRGCEVCSTKILECLHCHWGNLWYRVIRVFDSDLIPAILDVHNSIANFSRFFPSRCAYNMSLKCWKNSGNDESQTQEELPISELIQCSPTMHASYFLVLYCSGHRYQMLESSVSLNSPLLASRSGKLSKGSFLLYLERTNPRPASKLHYLDSGPLWLGYLNFL